jgi:hypothetical protein
LTLHVGIGMWTVCLLSGQANGEITASAASKQHIHKHQVYYASGNKQLLTISRHTGNQRARWHTTTNGIHKTYTYTPLSSQKVTPSPATSPPPPKQQLIQQTYYNSKQFTVCF